ASGGRVLDAGADGSGKPTAKLEAFQAAAAEFVQDPQRRVLEGLPLEPDTFTRRRDHLGLFGKFQAEEGAPLPVVPGRVQLWPGEDQRHPASLGLIDHLADSIVIQRRGLGDDHHLGLGQPAGIQLLGRNPYDTERIDGRLILDQERRQGRLQIIRGG
ncbi:MAG: hypothetical protein ACK56I_33335, partial [bacterium]